jgi:hypothetical protein
MSNTFYPRPGHFRVALLERSALSAWAVSILILACFFSTISSPGSIMKEALGTSLSNTLISDRTLLRYAV